MAQNNEEPVKLDWSFRAFLDACVEAPPTKTAAAIRDNKHAKRVAKKQKKQHRAVRRQTVAASAAYATHKAVRNLLNKS